MITCVIKNSGEANVISLTYENLWKELKALPGSEIIVEENWLDGVLKAKNKYICFVEADCLVSSGYFTSMAGHIKKNPQLGKLGILGGSTAVNNWAVKFYGYSLGDHYSDGIIPNKEKKGTSVSFYTSQVVYLPGAIIRVGMLKTILDEMKAVTNMEDDLVYLSTMVSLAFWRHNWMVFLAPNSTYCTTEEYVNDIGQFDSKAGKLVDKFAKESI